MNGQSTALSDKLFMHIQAIFNFDCFWEKIGSKEYIIQSRKEQVCSLLRMFNVFAFSIFSGVYFFQDIL